VRDDSAVDRSVHRGKLFTSVVHDDHRYTDARFVAESKKPSRDPNISYAATTTTPIRARKRVTIEERPRTPDDLPTGQKLNRPAKRTLTRSRSLSPLPTRYNRNESNQYPQRDMHDMDVEQDDSVFQVDFNAFQDADRKLVSRFAAISASVDLRLLHAEVETAASTLASVGVASARYWALDEANGTLTAYQGDDSVATLNPYQSELLMDFSRDSIQSFGARNADMLQNPHSVFTWLPSHPAYHAVRNVATHGLGARRFDGRSTNQQLGDFSTADVAVHAIKITSRCTG
jgi:hypothetical protein